LTWFGDLRLRMEQDWDSLQGDGTSRDDRLRLRVRLRGGLDYQFNDQWSAKLQARSGPHQSQQSPHITIHDFNGGATGPYQFNLDHWYLKYHVGGFEAWAGRNTLSFLHQDDLFVFDNVTYAGIGGSYTRDFAGSALYLSLNAVALPVGMRDFAGTGIVGQIGFDRRVGSAGFSAALGYRQTMADPGDPAGESLLTGNNTRDYREFSLQFQHRSTVRGRPLTLGVDVMHNGADYSGAPDGSFSQFHKNHVDGYVAQVLYGSKDVGDWQLGYFYSHLEALGANSSYVQDDWVRWGNASQVRATNMKGSEFRLLYTLHARVNIFARLFLVDAIDLLEPGDIAKESGNRLRIDLNWSF